MAALGIKKQPRACVAPWLLGRQKGKALTGNRRTTRIDNGLAGEYGRDDRVFVHNHWACASFREICFCKLRQFITAWNVKSSIC